MNDTPRLGTRGSPLAMAQARMAAAALETCHGWAAGTVEIIDITTTGDRIQDRPLADIGGKALWTKELDRCLLDRRTDFSVHSLKDVESIRPLDLRLAAMLKRADMRDRIIGADSIDGLKEGAVVGTSSPRRRAQLLSLRPDLAIVALRGNVGTRLAKLESGAMDAILLAAAGLDRLGMGEVGTPIEVEQMLPAPTQAVIALECRAEDMATGDCLEAIDDADTHDVAHAERAFTAALGGTCHSPLAALATVSDGRLRMRVQLLAEDGSQTIEDEATFDRDDREAPVRLARDLLGRAPDAIRRLFAA
jgi:hydroxymethylbilane synthase